MLIGTCCTSKLIRSSIDVAHRIDPSEQNGRTDGPRLNWDPRRLPLATVAGKRMIGIGAKLSPVEEPRMEMSGTISPVKFVLPYKFPRLGAIILNQGVESLSTSIFGRLECFDCGYMVRHLYGGESASQSTSSLEKPRRLMESSL